MNSSDVGLNREHCLQLCRQVRKLQVRGCAQEELTWYLPLGNLSGGLQNPEKAQARLCVTWTHLGKFLHLTILGFFISEMGSLPSSEVSEYRCVAVIT